MNQQLCLLVLCLWISLCAALNNVGTLSTAGTISSVGVSAVPGGSSSCGIAGNVLTLKQANSPRITWTTPGSSSSFYKVPLCDKTLSFTVDLSASQSGCNAALYFITPTSTQLSNTDAYCDAQGSGSTCCPEIDMFEANPVGYQGTMHSGAATTLAKNGCANNFRSAQGYGIGGSAIDTSKPFTCSMSFYCSASVKEVAYQLTQSGKSGIHFVQNDKSCSPAWACGVSTGCGSTYISSILALLKSNNAILYCSYWGGNMNWLDGTSATSCPAGTSAKFSAFTLSSSLTVAGSVAEENASSPDFVGTSGFYAVIGISVLVVLVAVVIAVVVWKRRASQQAEAV